MGCLASSQNVGWARVVFDKNDKFIARGDLHFQKKLDVLKNFEHA